MIIYEIIGGLVVVGLVVIGFKTVVDYLERKNKGE